MNFGIKMKEFVIFCDGGLGNRLGTLIGGLLVSDLINFKPIICWPENSWCGCAFSDLFSTDHKVIDNDINDLFSSNMDSIFIMHENQTKFKPNLILKHSKENYESASKLNKKIIYYHNKISSIFDEKEILIKLSQLEIKKDLLNDVKSFLEENSINKLTQGLHLRKTDSLYKIDDNSIYNFIKNKPTDKYFLCSDDKNTEEFFNNLDNVIINPKTYYVEKLKDGGWNDWTTDNEGRVFNFNVNRTKQSVIEAFQDMLILSRTNIIQNSNSTFLLFANKFSNIDL
jgi:hypothetical protein